MLFGNAIKLAQMAKFTDIKYIITTKGIRIHNAIRLNFLSDNRQ